MTHVDRLIEAFATPDGARSGLVQAAVLVIALLVAWLVARRTEARYATHSARWKFGEQGFQLVVFPLAALVLVFTAKLALRRWMDAPILDLANALLLAFAVIRFAVYVLRYVLPSGGLRSLSERSVTWAMWVGVALYLTGLLPEIREGLDAAAMTIGTTRVSLLGILQGVVSLAAALALTMWVARLAEGRIIANERMEMSTRVVASKLVNAVAFLAAILIALPFIGIDITALSVFGGALGVGLGFGLQKIASNYVSGFIILIDRSVRIGDLVTVDNRTGIVREIASRYTVVANGDGFEAIIPNETLITSTVINHTFFNRQLAVKVTLFVSAASDMDAVFAAMLAVARSHPRVLAEPAPAAAILRVADPGAEVELSAWIDDAQAGQGQVRSDLWKGVLAAFREQGIELPVPQREIRPPATGATGNTKANSVG